MPVRRRNIRYKSIERALGLFDSCTLFSNSDQNLIHKIAWLLHTDPNVTRFVEKVFITADNDGAASFNGTREKFVVIRISANGLFKSRW